MSSHSKSAKAVEKPHPDFPLYPHSSGRWAKKVRGNREFFGSTLKDPKGEAAIEEWLRVKDFLLAGKPRPPKGNYVSLKDVIDSFLHHKKQAVESGEMAQRTWDRYFAGGTRLADWLGRETPVANIGQSDFQKLRSKMAEKFGPVALGNEIQIVRSIFGYGVKTDLLEKEPKYGVSFDKPSAKTLRMNKAAKGSRLFTAEQLQEVMKLARPAMKAMILLGLNGGLGNTDVAEMTIRPLDLDGGWLDYPRIKTGMPRKVPLWPETVAAIRVAIQKRRQHTHEADADLLFIGARGESYVGKHKGYRVTAEFARLLKEAKIPDRSFYDLRRTFQTIAEEKSVDLVAVKAIMGHAPSSGDMSEVYRQRVTDERLRAVVDGVRGWLYPKPKRKAATKLAKKAPRKPQRKGDSPALRVMG